MAKRVPPLIGLAPYGRDWAPNIFFTESRDRAEFLRLADLLRREFAAELVEEYGGAGPDDKEYWTFRVAGSEWMLMRCYYPHGISLGGGRLDDLPAFESLARLVGAQPFGWRYRWLRFRRWLAGGKPVQGAQR